MKFKSKPRKKVCYDDCESCKAKYHCGGAGLGGKEEPPKGDYVED